MNKCGRHRGPNLRTYNCNGPEIESAHFHALILDRCMLLYVDWDVTRQRMSIFQGLFFWHGPALHFLAEASPIRSYELHMSFGFI